MNKTDLVAEIARRTDTAPATVAVVVDAFIDVVRRSVAKGEKVVLSGFGTFHRQSRARRTARNIESNQPLAVPATNVPAFRPGKPFREAVARRRRRAPATSAPGPRPGRAARPKPGGRLAT